MTAPVVTIDVDADLHDAFAVFRTHAVRRLAIVRAGQFVGMITVDDLLIDLAADLSDLARPVTAEVIFGHHDNPLGDVRVGGPTFGHRQPLFDRFAVNWVPPHRGEARPAAVRSATPLRRSRSPIRPECRTHDCGCVTAFDVIAWASPVVNPCSFHATAVEEGTS